MRARILCAALAAGAALQAAAQGYPAKPVRVVVTFAPGGAGDITGRLVGDKLAELWKQPVVIENRVGAGGRIGVEAVFRSEPDGYTTPMVLAVTPKMQARSVREFTDMARASPGKMDYATCGVATIMHFTGELYKHATRTFVVHIPHRGCGPAAAALAGGQIDVALTSMAPDVPTFRESGLPELKDFVVENYYGFMAPAATPKDIQARIQADLRRVMEAPDLLQRLANAGLDVFQRSPDEMRQLYRSDIDKFARAAAVADIRPE